MSNFAESFVSDLKWRPTLKSAHLDLCLFYWVWIKCDHFIPKIRKQYATILNFTNHMCLFMDGPIRTIFVPSNVVPKMQNLCFAISQSLDVTDVSSAVVRCHGNIKVSKPNPVTSRRQRSLPLRQQSPEISWSNLKELYLCRSDSSTPAVTGMSQA